MNRDFCELMHQWMHRIAGSDEQRAAELLADVLYDSLPNKTIQRLIQTLARYSAA